MQPNNDINNDEDYDEFDINHLQQEMNSHNWQPIDKYLSSSSLPSNKYYEVQIPDKQIQKYYLRFRYILQNEHTHYMPCTLALCTYLLKSSTNNYYALMLRKKIVNKELDIFHSQGEKGLQNRSKLLWRELKFMNNLLQDNPKQYHVWTYKKDLISNVIKKVVDSNSDKQHEQHNEQTTPMTVELNQQLYTSQNKFIFSLLIEDCRNYHAWDYRFWLVTYLNKIEEEFQWIQGLISTDPTALKPLIQETIKGIELGGELQAKQMKINWLEVNSLWSHKFNLIRYMMDGHTDNNNSKQQQDIRQQQIKTLISKQLYKAIVLLHMNRKNQPVWNYLDGLVNILNEQWKLTQQQQQQKDNKAVHLKHNIEQDLKLLFDETQISILQIDQMNRFELNFLKRHINLFGLKQQQHIQLSKKILLRLVKIDPTRQKYYDYLIDKESNSKL